MFKEFKKFISRGNVIDLAVGVIIGGAFNKIVTSLVNDVIMPLIGIVIGGIDFTSLSITFRDATINVGMFIQNIIDFLIVAFCIFVVIKFMNKLSSIMNKKEEKEAEKVPTVSEEILLLRQINESLQKQNKKPTKKTSKKEA